MWLWIPFVFLPIAEIALFIRVGGAIGVLPTIALVILSAMAGAAVMRRQGMAALAGLQQALEQLRDPAAPLARGAFAILAGVLLILPGFLTDALALALLVPAVQRRLTGRLGRRLGGGAGRFGAAGMFRGGAGPAGARMRPSAPVIEAEYVVIPGDGPRKGPRGPSGWTRH